MADSSFLNDVSANMFNGGSGYDGGASYSGATYPNYAPISMGSSNSLPDYSTAPNMSYVGPSNDYSGYSAGSTPGLTLPSNYDSSASGGSGAQAPDTSHWYSALTNAIGDQWNKDPLKVASSLGLGGLNAIGAMMTNKNSNKLARQIMTQNSAKMAYERQQMDRATKNQAIADKYNNSYDVTPAATAQYNPLTAEQAAHYGETGAPHQQLSITPGETKRVYLANGGMVNDGYTDSGTYGPQDGGIVNGYAQGGQADNVHAMLSEGEFVIPADVVSALGDGSTKAGSSALTQMMHEIRSMSRSAPNSSIPKAMGSPLSMIMGGK